MIRLTNRADATMAGRSVLWEGVRRVLHDKESNPFYHTKAWKRARAEALKRDNGMCCDCMERFRAGYGIKPRRASMVHHLQSVEDRPDLALVLANLRSLCDTCHNKRHPEKGERQSQQQPKHKMRVIKV